MEPKTVTNVTRETLNPNRDAEFAAARAPIRESTLLKVREAQKAYVDARGETIVSLANLGFAASFLSAHVSDIRHIKSLKEGFSYRAAAKYTPKDGEAIQVDSVAMEAFKFATARLVQERTANSWRYCNSLQSHGLYIAQLEKTFEDIKVEFIKATSEECRARCLGMSEKMTELGARVRSLLPSLQPKVAQLFSCATALKTYALESLGAPTVSYDEVTTQGPQTKTVPTDEFFARVEKAALDLTRVALNELPERAPAIQAILKHHGQAVAEQLEERPYSFTVDESLVLQHFSLKESLDNRKLEPAARRDYTELAEIVALSLVDLNRRDRAVAVKNLHRIGKQVGWDIIPAGIDDAYWQTLDVAAPAPAARAEDYQPVKQALAPFLKDFMLRTSGMKPAQLEKTVIEGTVEKTIAAVSAVVMDRDLAISIISSNPKLFVDFQEDTKAFLRFTELLRAALPKVEAARVQGRTTLPGQLSSSEAIVRWTEGEGRVDAFRAKKGEMVQVLRTLGFAEPELALTVLRAGCLNRGKYIAVSARTFDDFARKELEKSQQHPVAALRAQLVRAGLLVEGRGGQLTLASGVEGDGKRLLTWIRSNLPTSDLA